MGQAFGVARLFDVTLLKSGENIGCEGLLNPSLRFGHAPKLI